MPSCQIAANEIEETSCSLHIFRGAIRLLPPLVMVVNESVLDAKSKRLRKTAGLSCGKYIILASGDEVIEG